MIIEPPKAHEVSMKSVPAKEFRDRTQIVQNSEVMTTVGKDERFVAHLY